jgi:hypothetical protein
MPAAPTRPHHNDGVVIAIDPHKASLTAVVEAGLSALTTRRVQVSHGG